jgi:phosphate transport system ATP-binding protein
MAIETRALNLWYGDFQALVDVNASVRAGMITSLIGPSGCGKSTLLRSVNRINERLSYVRTTGSIHVMGHDIYSPEVELIQVRKKVGMVFQRPNPLPLSIRDNVLFGYRLHNRRESQNRAQLDEIVEGALSQVLLWDSVKDKLGHRAIKLSLEEQQKLCIARLLPVKPAVLLMDEPCSALDPIATARVEELIDELRQRYTIIMVTHSMQQAARVSQRTAFFHLGKLIEEGETERIFTDPRETRTQDYITGRFG